MLDSFLMIEKFWFLIKLNEGQLECYEVNEVKGRIRKD